MKGKLVRCWKPVAIFLLGASFGATTLALMKSHKASDPAATPVAGPAAEPEIQAPTALSHQFPDTGETVSTESIRSMALDPTAASLLLEKLRSQSAPLPLLSSLAAAVIHSLCRNGHVEEAWKLLDPSPGMVRQMQLTAYFSATGIHSKGRIDAQFEDLIREMDRSAAVMGLLQGNFELALTLKPSIIPGKSQTERNLFIGHLSSQLRHGELTPAQVDLALRTCTSLTALGLVHPVHLLAVFDSARSFEPHQAWDFFKDHGSASPPEISEKVFKGLASRMVRRDPALAMSTILGDRSSRRSEAILDGALAEFFSQSHQWADQWIDHPPQPLDSATMDAVLASASRVAIERYDFPAATARAMQISNPALKEELLTRIAASRSHP